jgi:hypothetical protein
LFTSSLFSTIIGYSDSFMNPGFQVCNCGLL